MSARGEWLDVVDRLAAERVLEWEVEDLEALQVRRPSAAVIRHDDGTMWRRTAPNAWSEKWSPTREISDAWILVEAMREIHWDVCIMADEYGSGRRVWRCRAGEDEWGDWTVRSEAPTAPLAITLAALRAHGVEIPEEPEDE